MKGSITRNAASGTYYGRVDVRRGAHGKRQQIRVKGRTKKEVESKIARIIATSGNNDDVVAHRVSMSDVFVEWLKSKAAVEFRTIESYKWTIKSFLEPNFGHEAASRMTASRIQTTVNEWAKAIVTPSNRLPHQPAGHRSANLALTVLSMVMKYAVTRAYCSGNPLPMIIRPTQKRAREKREYSLETVFAAIEATRHTLLFEPTWLACANGLRRGELVALERGDVDLQKREIAIRRAISCRGKTVVVKSPKTAKSRRTLPISERTAAILTTHLNAQQARMQLLGLSVSASAPLFDDGFERRWHPDAYSGAYRRALKKAGLKDAGLHALRHSFGSIARQSATSKTTIMALLGHESTKMTEQYGNVPSTVQRDAIERLSHLLGGS